MAENWCANSAIRYSKASGPGILAVNLDSTSAKQLITKFFKFCSYPQHHDADCCPNKSAQGRRLFGMPPGICVSGELTHGRDGLGQPIDKHHKLNQTTLFLRYSGISQRGSPHFKTEFQQREPQRRCRGGRHAGQGRKLRSRVGGRPNPVPDSAGIASAVPSVEIRLEIR